MPFKHVVDKDKNIVVVKAKGNVSIADILTEIQTALKTKRGAGISRRLIDMTKPEITLDFENPQKILKMMNTSADVLGSRKVAILFNQIPEGLEFEKLQSLMNSSKIRIELFTDKAKAANFLSAPAKK